MNRERAEEILQEKLEKMKEVLKNKVEEASISVSSFYRGKVKMVSSWVEEIAGSAIRFCKRAAMWTVVVAILAIALTCHAINFLFPTRENNFSAFDRFCDYVEKSFHP